MFMRPCSLAALTRVPDAPCHLMGRDDEFPLAFAVPGISLVLVGGSSKDTELLLKPELPARCSSGRKQN